MPVVRPWGERVLAARSKVGVTQKEFAKRLGCSEQIIYKWEQMLPRPYSVLADWFIKVEAQIDKMDDEEARKWLGPQEPEDF